MSVTASIATLPVVAVGSEQARSIRQYGQRAVLCDTGRYAALEVLDATGSPLVSLLLLDGLPEGYALAAEDSQAVVVTGGLTHFPLAVSVSALPPRTGVPAVVEAVASFGSYPLLALDGLDALAGTGARFATPLVAGSTDLNGTLPITVVCEDAPAGELGAALAEDAGPSRPVIAGGSYVGLVTASGELCAAIPTPGGAWAQIFASGGHVLVEEFGQLALFGPRPALG